ncbi:MAG: type II toxin-antitoxin system RatA family toxin [Pseudomonadales bacterium]
MPQIQRSALLHCSPERMYRVVSDVERYPEFVPYCVAARASADGDAVIASLDLAAKGFKEQFTTRNVAIPNERLDMQLVDGPFSVFTGVWQLQAIGDAGCQVDLTVDFEFRGGLKLLGRVVGRSVGLAADRIVDAFCQRAEGADG